MTGASSPVLASNGVRSTTSISAGRPYAEFLMNVLAGAGVGLADQNAVLTLPPPRAPLLATGTQAALRASGYYIGVDGLMTQLSGPADVVPVTGDVVSVAPNLDTGLLWFAVNGVYLNAGNPALGLNPNVSFPPNTPLFLVWHGYNNDVETMRTARGQFTQPVPTGFSPWDVGVPVNTANFYIDNVLVHRDDRPRYSYN